MVFSTINTYISQLTNQISARKDDVKEPITQMNENLTSYGLLSYSKLNDLQQAQSCWKTIQNVEKDPLIKKVILLTAQWQHLDSRLKSLYDRQIHHLNHYVTLKNKGCLLHFIMTQRTVNKVEDIFKELMEKLKTTLNIIKEHRHNDIVQIAHTIEKLMQSYLSTTNEIKNNLQNRRKISEDYLKKLKESPSENQELTGIVVGGVLGSPLGIFGTGTGAMLGKYAAGLAKKNLQNVAEIIFNNNAFGPAITPKENQHVHAHFLSWSTGYWGKLLLQSSQTVGNIKIHLEDEEIVVWFNLNNNPPIDEFEMYDLFTTLEYKRKFEELKQDTYRKIIRELRNLSFSSYPHTKEGFLLDYTKNLSDEAKNHLFNVDYENILEDSEKQIAHFKQGFSKIIA